MSDIYGARSASFQENMVDNLMLPSTAAMAEWLRRLTRNQMGSSRVGSNPTRSDDSF